MPAVPTPRGLFHGDQREAEPDENDADVFHAVIGEQAFQIVLAQRERDAEHRADHAQRRHHRTRLGGTGSQPLKRTSP